MNGHHQIFGLYQPGDSWLHRVPVGWKFALMLALSLGTLIVGEPLVSGGSLVLTVLVLLSSRVPWRPALRLGRGLLVLLVVLAIYQLIFESWQQAVVVVGNLLACLFAARILTMTVPGADLLDGLVTAATPVRIFGIDPERIGLAVGLMMRSIPYLAGSFADVRDAARARGLERNVLAQVSPVVVNAVAYAQATGDALAARGLGEAGNDHDSERHG